MSVVGCTLYLVSCLLQIVHCVLSVACCMLLFQTQIDRYRCVCQERTTNLLATAVQLMHQPFNRHLQLMECTTRPRRASSKNLSLSTPKEKRVEKFGNIAMSPDFRKKKEESHFTPKTRAAPSSKNHEGLSEPSTGKSHGIELLQTDITLLEDTSRANSPLMTTPVTRALVMILTLSDLNQKTWRPRRLPPRHVL